MYAPNRREIERGGRTSKLFTASTKAFGIRAASTTELRASFAAPCPRRFEGRIELSFYPCARRQGLPGKPSSLDSEAVRNLGLNFQAEVANQRRRFCSARNDGEAAQIEKRWSHARESGIRLAARKAF